MKIRQGSVSNSSSSSFVLIGVEATAENKKKLEEKFPRKTNPDDGEIPEDEDDCDADFNYHERLDEEYNIHYLYDEYNTDKIGILLGYERESLFELSRKEVNGAFDKMAEIFDEPKLFSGIVAN